jgi:hypothetical protein
VSRGGARINSGPAPDPNALRRERDKGQWTILPIEGRGSVPAPEWPLADESAREVEFWVEFWRKPQAVLWELLRLEYEVALMVRNLVMVERGAPVSHGALLRQQMDSLGLTVRGLRANRWVIPRAERGAAG